ncbi:DNA polymerase III subunit alpha [Ktedonospora formicarum]|uniref:DNA polymerase III subunit alpha n=1 Tax=Ktedonospora formicarum TaxID=2778364 RepID=A0A8J3MQV2_9CHLR|nr:DNA polymerase III subunit alpha [Ktedonospora formicarum]GHO44350.1 DNA-directed DNA polymerase [Ktedonospora formicarum]
MGIDFAHLHVHTEYSLLDGLSHINKLVQQTRDLGMKHLAITDHGAMYGALEFYKACQAGGIHPLIGCEAYLTEDMHDHSKRYSDDYYHLLLLAYNNTGYRNLMKLTTIANTEGYHLRPRIDKKVLETYAEGLIVTSGCLSAEIPKLLLAEKQEAAYQAARWYQNVFGLENVYLEIQEHHGTWDNDTPSPQARLNQLLYQMHKDLHIPLVATNDLHYIRAQDAHTHDVLLCIQTGKQIDAQKRFKFDSQEYYLKSPAEMLQLFPELPDALTNTVRLAERCEANPLLLKANLPLVDVPPQYTNANDYLYALCMEGVKYRFGEMSEPVKRQLDYEFSIIMQKGYTTYFLMVWDYVNYARSHGIRCSARGSAAGSLLAYVLGITNVDPLRYQLLFERFLNPERSDMPDIDMDFPDDRREEVINYVASKYGPDCVSQMVTFNTMAARQSVKDVARAMGRQELGDRITRLIPSGPRVTLQGSLDSVRDLNATYEQNTEAREVIDEALKLEGAVRNTGIHAAGIVIAGEPLEHFVPLQRRDFRDPSKGLITQYEQAHLEELGLIKFDFLGLSNLTILDNTLKFIKEARGEEIDLEKLPLDETNDPEQNRRRAKAFELLAAGETTGIFQLEGAKMREYIKQLKPTSIEDITAMVALYRPGPMDSIPDFINAKHGRTQVAYLDERLKEWLEESYGIIVYQDQVLLIAVHLAGFSWGKVNKFRKALSKKIMQEVESYKEDFIQGCIHNGMRPDIAEKLFELILPFGGYGFNKAHAASYAVVAFYTAYLKANYTAEFMAATMTTEAADARKIANAIAECKRMDVKVLGPDVNKSSKGFTVEVNNVRFGLLAIKGIGDAPIDAIIEARQKDGPFTSLADFCTRANPQSVGKGAIETLIKVGALDTLGARHILLASLERAMQYGKNEREAKERGLLSLFGDIEGFDNALAFSLNTNVEEPPAQQLLDWEHELIGVYITQHPLAHLSDALATYGLTHNLGQITDELDGRKVIVGGMIKEARRIVTKKGDDMCVIQLEDMYGSLGVTVFPRVYEQTRERWVENSIVIIKGSVQVRRDEPGILCDTVAVLEVEQSEAPRKAYQVWLTLQISGSDTQAIEQDMLKVQDIYRHIQERPGRDHYEILVSNTEWQVRLTPSDNTMHYSEELRNKLEEILGKGSVEATVAS